MANYNGSAGNDSITGTPGNDQAMGNGGNDTINAGDGQDTISGGDGNDSLSGGNGYDIIMGDAGDDKLYGGNDTYSDLYGGAGNDSIYAGDANEDWAWGGDGQDHVQMGGGSDIGYGGAGQDSVYGGTGNDTVSGASGNDQVFGDAGNDKVYGGSGRDTLDGGSENDTLGGGSGGDSIQGGSGNDLIYGDRDAFVATLDASRGPQDTTLTVNNAAPFAVDVYWIDGNGTAQYVATIQPGASYSTPTGSAHNWYLSQSGTTQPLEVIYGAPNQTVTFGPDFNDTLSGGAGDDTIHSDYGSDLISGDEGNDSINAGDGNDTVSGGIGNDTVSLGAGHDSFGNDGAEAGDDTIDGGAGHDSINAGAGNDIVFGGDGNDTVAGGDGADLIHGGAGQDLLLGGAGNDTLSGGADNDTLQGGSGSDTLYGGAGQDSFRFESAGGGDVIADFDLSRVEGQTADQLDVSDLRTPAGDAVRAWDVTVSDDGFGNAVLTFPQGESVVLQGISPEEAMADGMLSAMGVPCFAQGSRIDTPTGPRAVETIMPGDFVRTPDGMAPVLWHAVRAISIAELADAPQHRPVRIAAGAIGNLRALILSPQHGVCVPGVTGLIRARHLAELGQGARVAADLRSVCYHHLLLPRHALIRTEAAWVESFYPGPMAVAALRPADRLALALVVAAQSRRVSGSLAERYGRRVLPLLSRKDAAAALRRLRQLSGLRLSQGIT